MITDSQTIQPIEVETFIQLKGQKASKGKVVAPICIINNEEDISKFVDGAILATQMTTPKYVALFAKAAGVVTQTGGILCHAAIVSREYGIPCLVGITNLLGQVENNRIATLDADNGVLIVPKPATTQTVKDAKRGTAKQWCVWCESDSHDIENCPESYYCSKCEQQVDTFHTHDDDEIEIDEE